MPMPSLLRCATALAFVLATPAALAETAPAAAPAAAAPVAPDTVVAKVNGQPITGADIAVAADDPALSLPGVDEAQKKGLLVDYMVDLKVGAQAAEAAKVADTPDFKRKLAYFRDKLLLDEYLEREAKKAATPEAAKAVYDQSAKLMKPEEEVHARHILVDNEAEAKKIAARIKGGEDFAKVAGETSKDPGSKTEGGDLGWFTKERMVKEFADAAFKMQPGQVSDPVKTQFGWHVIRVEEKRVKPLPTFEELREQIDQHLIRKAQQDLILKLRSEAKIERTDAASAATPTPAAPPAETPKKP
ncbi:peptidylprolyl isomerase [Methylobacterium dankookense]|uniref:Parvulin-like PPIase n=1 Tax=Methylobacterium dankookense TaxID=560405 RepID=A0A564FXI3_9HYPH|nr:peptidylprolyl isomerase [Methylobacterium dankookense]GJD55948.1 putative parvulin-type peptidyl-prolyl cis-trans isomerase [Methylobacterium dankookense]VUF12853.1 putative parvulin-type peptidyl-prolyl cis-trans isomerase [Methylobacterium dankookense]